MAKGVKIPVSVELQAEKRSLESIQDTLQQTLNNVGKDTTFASHLRKSLAQIGPMLERYGELTIQPEIDDSGLRELDRIAKQVYGIFDKMREQGAYLDLGQMAAPEDLQVLQQFHIYAS